MKAINVVPPTLTMIATNALLDNIVGSIELNFLVLVVGAAVVMLVRLLPLASVDVGLRSSARNLIYNGTA